ncbi:cysteine hydrolase [Paenibacillus psychroresistens]|uniref:Cysteine hydrolase n=1 Tax=Paenibacillus psychroresistens TaxID=1778678 RepID=A0A6B8RFH1_9BACL|nr:isochorismatase family cysteine hydrolase [Paenibacillus psychroresistens]QGQ94116.1 cysteine hydrolase [Paenibacillus psychroresistens]
MINKNYNSATTGLLLVDPYNDFLSPEGKLYPYAKEVAESVNLLSHLQEIVAAVRHSGIQVFFVPHHRWVPGDYANWKHPSPNQLASGRRQSFAKNTWGGEFHADFLPQSGDIIIKEHWGSSGFANTDLDYQLKMHGIDKIIIIGLLANTCIESTARYGTELGYHVTIVKDATAAFSKEAMHAAHEINGPTFAHSILTTQELISDI